MIIIIHQKVILVILIVIIILCHHDHHHPSPGHPRPPDRGCPQEGLEGRARHVSLCTQCHFCLPCNLLLGFIDFIKFCSIKPPCFGFGVKQTNISKNSGSGRIKCYNAARKWINGWMDGIIPPAPHLHLIYGAYQRRLGGENGG